MSEPTFRDANETDLGLLLPMMGDFYRDEGIGWDPTRMPAAAARLLSDPALGRVVVLERDGELYRRAGFPSTGRAFLTRTLSD